MRRLLLAAFVLSCGMSGLAAAEEKKPEEKKPDLEMSFKKRDKNSDGFLTEEEFIGKQTEAEKVEKIKKSFAAKDKDSDKKLSLEEFKAPAKKKSDK